MEEKTKIKLPWGSKDGKLIHISDADNGIECGCVCPSCKAQLVARNEGKIRIPHFAHYKEPDCGDALETAMHIIAKQTIAKTRKLYLPPVNLKKGNFLCAISKGGIFEFDKVELEKKSGDFIPDVTCYIADKPMLFVEITVTHGIDEDKAFEIKRSGVSCLEIKLNREKHYEKETIQKMILGEHIKEKDALFEDIPDNYGSFWIINEFKTVINGLIFEIGRHLKVTKGDTEKYADPFFINGCPAEKQKTQFGRHPYARKFNCKLCDYNLDGTEPEEQVFCIGHAVKGKILDNILQRIKPPC